MEDKRHTIDFYEFTMDQTYYDIGEENKKVYFDVFFRTNPAKGGYTIMGGLDEIIDYVKNFKLSKEYIQKLRERNCFSEEFLKKLETLKFTGDMYAVPNGTPVFPNEPVITIRANTLEAQLIETCILNNFNYPSLVATSSKRIVDAADGRPVMEFGARRAPSYEAANMASKYSYIAGCCGTSNTAASNMYDIPALGTMAHSLICDMEDEYNAFINFAKSNPDNCVFLVDTLDTLNIGIPNAIRVAKEYLIPNGIEFKGIRIDSGDLAYLSKEARRMLDEAGFKDAKICLSNDLDADIIESLRLQGAFFDSLGVGTRLVHPERPLGGVYKLVAIEENGKIIPKIKVSNDTIKTINPGYKKLYRFYDKDTNYALGDVIALYDEVIPEDEFTLVCPTDELKTTTIKNYNIRELQVPIFKNGELVYEQKTVEEQKEYCAKEFETLYPEIKRFKNPHEYYVDLTINLLKLKKDMIMKVKEKAVHEAGQIRKLTKNN